MIKICGEFLVYNLTEINALEFYRLGIIFCCEHVSSRIGQFLCINCKSSLFDSREAFGLTFKELSWFLKSDELNVKEEELVNFIQEWSMENTITDSELGELMQWSKIKRMPPRVCLAIGGWTTTPTNTVEVYNYLSNTWSISFSLPINSAYHGAAEIEETLYIAGGFAEQPVGYMLDCLHSFNMSTMVWKELSSMLTKRCYIATSVLDGKLFALGGHDGFDRLKTVEMYDPKINMWTEMPSMLQKRSDFCVAVFHGKIFAIGGFDGQVYTPLLKILNCLITFLIFRRF